jgi:hypothetical protein
MTREDMIRMARETGWQYADGDDGYNALWRFAALVAEAERKAEREEILGFCERMCEAHRIVGYVVSPILKEVMKYIRERGSK